MARCIFRLRIRSIVSAVSDGRKQVGMFTGAPNVCIYRVPKPIRKRDESAFTPQVISIGPYHHGKEELQSMSEFKKIFLKNFLERSRKGKESFLEFVRKREERLRNCYFEPIGMGSHKLVEIVLEDAAFVLELFYRISFREPDFVNDRLVSKIYMVTLIMNDMILLENQLPFFILEELLDFANIHAPLFVKEGGLFKENEKLSMVKLSFSSFSIRKSFRVHHYNWEDIRSHKVLHFLDLLRICLLPADCNEIENNKPASIKAEEIKHAPSATELQQAGVKFKKSESTNLFEVKFNRKDGVLQIPCFALTSVAEILFRNLLVFEQFHYPGHQHLTDYMRFLTHLVNVPKDVDILVHNQIFRNRLDDSFAATTLLNNIVRGTYRPEETFYFSNICKELMSYYNDPRHMLIATLKQDYFNTPWAGISVVAAAMLLGCAILQTAFTITK